MPTYLNGKRPRRITKIRVDEISEVDRPANGIPFCMYKRDVYKTSFPELAMWAPRVSVNKSTSTEYDSSAVSRLLTSVIKAGEAPGDGTHIPPDDMPPDLTAEDYARARDRIDAAGVVTVNSPRLYPPFHVPSAVDRTDPVTV